MSAKPLPELTIKVFVISIVLAVLLAASNTFLALKIGTTVAASIPASVLALGLLRFFKQSNVLECNIIQTAASAGEGVAAAVAFVLPAMILLYQWHGFPFWETFLLTFCGGVLGVLFSVPLRRVMLTMPTLRFPEGTAIGNVLLASKDGSQDLSMLVKGGLVGGWLAFLQGGLKLISDNLQLWWLPGKTVIGFALGFTPATLAAGYIIGIEVCMSILVGVILGWFGLLPWLVHHFGYHVGMTGHAVVMSMWSKHLRYIAVGTMLVGGVWTLLRLIKPVYKGLQSSLSQFSESLFKGHGVDVPRTERDIPLIWVMLGCIVISIIIFVMLLHYFTVSGLVLSNGLLITMLIVTCLYILVIGFLLATVCGYFTGLIGSTNNPLSGLIIIALLALSLLYLGFLPDHVIQQTDRMTAIIIMIATMVSVIGAISMENLQDLKAGLMVGATPWKQQLILLVGVTVSSLVIGPILNLLFHAYGIGGVFPHAGMDRSQMLAAPQAGMMAAVAKGVLMHHVEWGMMEIGGVIAVVVIVIDEWLKRYNYRLAVLAVGLGMYLPMSVNMPIIIGGVVSYLVKRHWHRVKAKVAHVSDKGVILACGLVAGSALMGVILAIPFVLMGSSTALSVVSSGFVPIANVFGVISILGLCVWLYKAGCKQ